MIERIKSYFRSVRFRHNQIRAAKAKYIAIEKEIDKIDKQIDNTHNYKDAAPLYDKVYELEQERHHWFTIEGMGAGPINWWLYRLFNIAYGISTGVY